MSTAPVPNYSIPPAPKPQGMAVAGMVLGIVACVTMCWLWWLSIPVAIVGLVLSMIANGKAKRGEAGGKGMALTGLILSIVALSINVVILILGVIGLSMFGSEIQKEMERQQRNQSGAPSGILRFGIESVWYNAKALLVR